MKSLVSTITLIVIGFFAFVGLTIRQKIEAAIHVSGKTCFFEIGNGKVKVIPGFGSLPGTGIKHRIVKTDPGSPFTDIPTTQTPISFNEFLSSAFADPYFGGISNFSVPYWWIAVLFTSPFAIIVLRRMIRMHRSKKEANKSEISSLITPPVD